MKKILALVLSLVLACALCSAPALAESSQKAVTLTLDFYFGLLTGEYTGDLDGSVPNGQGVFVGYNSYNIQWTYTGQWKEGHMHGIGGTVWEDGWSEYGYYFRDQMIGGQSFNNGVLVHDGTRLDEQYHGYGVLYNDMGQEIFSGTFDSGCLVETAEERRVRADSLESVCSPLTQKDYNALMKDEAAYRGRMVKLTGTVDYIWDNTDYSGSNEFELLLGGVYDYPIDVYYRYAVDEKLTELNGPATVWGTVIGIYHYTGDDGKEYAMPLVQAHVVFPE